jgi:putative membrane protein
MHSGPHANFQSWSFPVPLTSVLVLVAFAYSLGWFNLRKTPNSISLGQLGAFMSGLLSLWIALGSPLAALDHHLLSIHMVEHILLMTVAPPLILLGAPILAFRHSFPQRFVRRASSLFLRRPFVEKLGRFVTHPVLCWVAAMGALVAWHVPEVFALALRSHSWHVVEYTCFFVTGILFWWPVVQPWPSVARWPRWCIPLYLFLATLPCDALSGFLVFCDRVVYTSYLTEPRLFNILPLRDQECAGALMWTCATFIYLIPAVVVTVQILSPVRAHPAEQPRPLCSDSPGRSFAADVEVL